MSKDYRVTGKASSFCVSAWPCLRVPQAGRAAVGEHQLLPGHLSVTQSWTRGHSQKKCWPRALMKNNLAPLQLSIMWNQFHLDSIHCIFTVIKNNTVPLFPQILMNVLLGEFSAHALGTASILLGATFAGVIKALIWCTSEANTNAMVITSYFSCACDRAVYLKIKLMIQRGMFLYYGWNMKQVVLHCFGILRKGWTVEIDCARQSYIWPTFL